MYGAAHNLDREFWHPPLPNTSLATKAPAVGENCARCNTELLVGSRFCHVCGTERAPSLLPTSQGLSHYLEFQFLRDSLGLTTGALIAFVFGLVCAVMAAATGLAYSTTTLVDWQAVQIWRIEWLLASATAFLAGILLKRGN